MIPTSAMKRMEKRMAKRMNVVMTCDVERLEMAA